MTTTHADTTAPTESKPAHRPLDVIANEIHKDWKNVNYAARPYLAEMGRFNLITDGEAHEDGAKSCVLYFLSNAGTWKGETAKRIKAELKSMLKG
tara:strand:- start:216 stop:500 length:285 start_codon:yes stop_codon:yes gene_type:complete